jgi:phosphate:Na+ symporter
MNLWATASGFIGGLGLFLLGMTMLTDGLKLAAGPALQRILAAATRTRWHALGSGVLVTALVQSSSAITVAAIGFVNAGLMPLGPALWVLFGANVGTTMTGWIVALVGLKFKIEALALPLIGLGVLLRLSGEMQRRGAVGTALAGFGLLFFGIAVLQQSFGGLAGQVSLPLGEGWQAVLSQMAIGVLMTVLMQSSSASMTIALTAAQGGLLSVEGAAAVVIGANVGTTVTALLAAMGATANAKRAASAHVAFNLLTAAVALALLPWLLQALGTVASAMNMAHDPATQLALFHTIFNLLGVMLMWPLAERLTAWLQLRFRGHEDDEAQPQYLDDNVLAVPALAVDALRREVVRLGHVALRMARGAAMGTAAVPLAKDDRALRQLAAVIEAFVERMNRNAMPARASERLAHVLLSARRYQSIAEQALLAAGLRELVAADQPALRAQQQAMAVKADALLQACDAQLAEPDLGQLTSSLAAFEADYEALKSALLAAGATGAARIFDMEEALRRHSALRRAVQQAVKAHRPESDPLAD